MKKIINIKDSNIAEWMKNDLIILQDKGVIFKQIVRVYPRVCGTSKEYSGEITAHFKGKMYYPNQLVSAYKSEKPQIELF